MRFRSILALSSLMIALGLFFSSAEAETFSTNLTVGSRGVEVSALQQTLVAGGYLVMPVGVSYGYFGLLTKAAVAKWQVANNVSPALGYFGPISRATLAAKTNTPSQTTPTEPLPDQTTATPVDTSPYSRDIDTPFAMGMRVNHVMVFRASPFEVRPGGLISIDGSGFSKTTNKVYFDDGHEVVATSTDGVSMNVVVPENISNGEYKISVSNVWGSSNNPDIKIKIKVTNNPELPPNITSASISGDTVTVVGTGFTSSNNLFTTLGDSSSSINSDGTTLTFRITDLSRYEQIKSFTQGKYQVALFIFIQNEHGMNKDPYQLSINL